MLTVISDIDTPDWDAFGAELERQMSIGPRRVALMLGPDCRVTREDPKVLGLLDRLTRSGGEAVILAPELRDDRSQQ